MIQWLFIRPRFSRVLQARVLGGLLVLAGWALVAPQRLDAQVAQEMTIRASHAVLQEMMAIPLRAIPASLLADAQGVAIIPNVLKGGLVVGARHGRGVLIVRNPDGTWRPPVFISLTGGNIGFQIGVQATDLVLVFRTRKSIEGILSGKFTVGGDAAAAAGPIGRQASAATDVNLRAEIYSYSRSRGLFAGISIDGSVLQVDHTANALYFQPPERGGEVVVPQSADLLVQQVAAYASGRAGGNPPLAALQPQMGPQPAAPLRPPADPAVDRIRHNLAESSKQLFALLDQRWRAHLALPEEVYQEGGRVPHEALTATRQRYDQVAADARFRVLIERPEFQTTRELLVRLESAVSPTSPPPTLQLPEPP